MLKWATIQLDNAGLADYLVLEVHDECIFDAPEDIADDVRREAERVMTFTETDPPLTTGGKVVERWGDPYR